MSETRNAKIADAVVIEAWQRIANQVDADGEKTGSINQVADEIGMKKDTLQQRIVSLRKQLAAVNCTLAKMPRAKGGGKKKDLTKLADLFNQINGELVDEADAEAETELVEA